MALLAAEPVCCWWRGKVAAPPMTRGRDDRSAKFCRAFHQLELVEEEVACGLDLIAAGEMGIGNTTPSSAIIAAFTGLPVAQVTGRGTGISEPALAHKIAVIERALAVNQPDPRDPIDVMAKVGGVEIAAMAG